MSLPYMGTVNNSNKTCKYRYVVFNNTSEVREKSLKALVCVGFGRTLTWFSPPPHNSIDKQQNKPTKNIKQGEIVLKRTPVYGSHASLPFRIINVHIEPILKCKGSSLVVIYTLLFSFFNRSIIYSSCIYIYIYI